MNKVFVRLSGGLGNQLYQIAAGMYLSKIINSELFVDDSSCKKLSTHNGDRLGNLGYILPRISWLDRVRYLFIPKLLKKIGFISKSYIRDIDLGNEFLLSDLSCGNYYLDGYWQNCFYSISVFDELHSTITLPKANSKYSDLIDNASHSVSLHIRRGDFLKSDGNFILPLSYFLDSLELLQSRYEELSIFVFSDDIDWCKNILSSVDEFSFFFVDDTCNELEDFYLIHKCDSKIISNSTFSWWAAFLGDDFKSLVLYPLTWDLDNFYVSRIPFRSNWIGIKV